MIQAQRTLRRFSSPQKAKFSLRFFKTGPGQYGEGDIFLGATMPEIRSVAAQFLELPLKEISALLKSPYHEDRMLGLIILITQYKKRKDLTEKKKLLTFYLKNKNGINNWDLVDVSTANILGDWCFRTDNESLMWKLARSDRHWDKRLAMVATLAFIKMGQPGISFKMAKMFLSEKEDLMHKAAGWMLREAGKKDIGGLRSFIKKNGKKMPRTMLRYSIEKFSKSEQKRILKTTK